MANEKRLIDANALLEEQRIMYHYSRIENAPTVDAVEVPDEDLLQAVKLLIKQYQRSKNADYVHSPVAHALFHTWKHVDKRRG